MATKSLSMGQYRMIGTISKLLRHTSSNRRICGSLTLAQICPYGQTSHIPRTLCEIPNPAFMLVEQWLKEVGKW